MSGSLWGDDDEPQPDPEFRPVWEDTDEPDDGPPSIYAKWKPVSEKAETGIAAPLLQKVAETIHRLSRLDALVECASANVRDGMIGRIAFREASGWLTQASQWVHPSDLALRSLGMVQNYTSAALSGTLANAMPSTLVKGSDQGEEGFETVPEDRVADLAIAYARHLQRLATRRSWRPLHDPKAVEDTLGSLGMVSSAIQTAMLSDWHQTLSDKDDKPPILASLDAAQRWRTADDGENSDEIDLRAAFVAAAMMVGPGRLQSIVLPLWAARPVKHGNRTSGSLFLKEDRSILDLLDLISESALSSGQELRRLQDVETRGAELYGERSKGSKLGLALALALRSPVLTPRVLSQSLRISDRSATGLLGELLRDRLLREATGRKRYRAFVI